MMYYNPNKNFQEAIVEHMLDSDNIKLAPDLTGNKKLK